MNEIPVIVVGLGPIGRLCSEIALERRNIRVVAAVDINPELIGRDLGEVLGREPRHLPVMERLHDALNLAETGVAVLTTTSDMTKLADHVKSCIRAGWHVVTTCEEMAYPWITRSELARELDDAARTAGRTVLGTGVNPGFTMDVLPALLTGGMRRVDSVVIQRFQDASTRRLPFQQKIGAGLSLSEFLEKVKRREIRHVGFTESIHMIAAAVGLELERVEEQVRPVMATSTLSSAFLTVKSGEVAGIDQIAQGFIDGQAVITLNLQAYLGHPDPKERTVIAGDPPLEMVIPGGVPGDISTCAMTVNAVPAVVRSAPGLRTMLDVVIPTCLRP